MPGSLSAILTQSSLVAEIPLVPGDLERTFASGTAFFAGWAADGRAGSAVRADGVRVAPALREPVGILRSRHDGPPARTCVRDLEVGPEHAHRRVVHIEDRFVWTDA